MRIARAELVPFRLVLRAPLRTAHGEIAVREGSLLALHSECGAVGWGEASPIPGFGLESPSECESATTASRMAAISSGSGGRGMYSFAPA